MSETSRMKAPLPVRTVRITWRSAFLAVSAVLGFVVLRGAFIGAHRVLGWTAASIAVAVFVEPIVEQLARWIPRALAVLVTFLVIAGVAGGLVFGTVDDLDGEVARLQRVMPAAVDGLEQRDDELGRIARELDLSTRTESFLGAVDDRVGSGSDALAQNAPTFPVYFVSAILTIFLLVYGPRIARGAVDQVGDDRRRDRISRILEESTHRARRTMSALLTQGATVGLMVFSAAWALDLPAPIVLSLIAGVLAMLPDVGILMGTLPTAVLAAAMEGVGTAAAVMVVALGLQLVEALYLRRQIREVGVDVGPAVVWIVALVGFTIYGPGMAFYGVAYAVFALAVIDEVSSTGADESQNRVARSGPGHDPGNPER